RILPSLCSETSILHIARSSRKPSSPLILPLLRQPLVIYARRNFGRLDLAAPAPEHVGVRNGDIARPQVLIDRRFMIEEQSFVRATRDSYDIDVPEFRTALAPVAVR